MASVLHHFGWLVSPYSAKTRAYLEFKGIPFEDHVPSARRLYTEIRPAVGRVLTPHGGPSRQSLCKNTLAFKGAVPGEKTAVIIGKPLQRQGNLPKIACALDPAGLVLGLGQHRQQHRRKNANNGNHHQQLDQGEGLVL